MISPKSPSLTTKNTYHNRAIICFRLKQNQHMVHARSGYIGYLSLVIHEKNNWVFLSFQLISLGGFKAFANLKLSFQKIFIVLGLIDNYILLHRTHTRIQVVTLIFSSFGPELGPVAFNMIRLKNFSSQFKSSFSQLPAFSSNDLLGPTTPFKLQSPLK